MMSHRVSSFLASIALSMPVAACAGPTTQAGSASTASAGPPARSGLSGTWHGYFVHSGADYTSPSSADLMLEVRPDSTYTFKWGSRPQRTGTVAAQGNRVVFDDSSGSRSDQAGVAQRCEARGGVYFAGGDYCEVPATGLRP